MGLDRRAVNNGNSVTYCRSKFDFTVRILARLPFYDLRINTGWICRADMRDHGVFKVCRGNRNRNRIITFVPGKINRS